MVFFYFESRADFLFSKLTAFFYYIIIVSRSLVELNVLNGNLANLTGAIHRLLDVLEIGKKDKYNKKLIALKEPIHSIEFRDVSFFYPSNPKKLILKNLSFRIIQGEKVGIFGSSGIGKTTVFNIITSLYKPTSGKVLINGLPLDTLIPDTVNSKLSVVLQDHQIFSGNLRENIMLANPFASKVALHEALKQANISDFIKQENRLSDVHVGEKGIRLSGGQRQRVQIARSLLRDSKFYLLDEPTSSLDQKNEKNILEKFFLRNKKTTILLITHKKSALRYCDRLLTLH